MPNSRLFFWLITLLLGAAFGGALWVQLGTNREIVNDGPSLSSQTKNCLDALDYGCLVKLSYHFPPRDPQKTPLLNMTEKQRLIAAKSIAYLGETDMAMELYENDQISKFQFQIVSAVILYHLAYGKLSDIEAVLDRIPSVEERILVLDSAQRTAFAFNYVPELGSKLHGLVEKQLAAAIESKTYDSKRSIIAPLNLAQTNFKSLQLLAQTIKHHQRQANYLAHLTDSYKIALNRRREERQIAELLHSGKIEDLSNLFTQLSLLENGKDQSAYSFINSVRNRNFLRISPQNNLRLLDQYIEAITLSFRQFESDPGCKSQFYTMVAGLYAKSGHNDKGLERLNHFRDTDNDSYHDKGYETDCLIGGYYLNSITRALLGDSKEFASAARYFVSHIDQNTSFRSQSAWRLQTGWGFSLFGSYANGTDLSEVFSFVKEVLDTYFPQKQSSDKRANLTNSYLSNFIEKALRAGYVRGAIELGQQLFSSLPNDMPDSFFRDQFLPMMVNSDFHRSFIRQMAIDKVRTLNRQSRIIVKPNQ